MRNPLLLLAALVAAPAAGYVVCLWCAKGVER